MDLFQSRNMIRSRTNILGHAAIVLTIGAKFCDNIDILIILFHKTLDDTIIIASL